MKQEEGGGGGGVWKKAMNKQTKKEKLNFQVMYYHSGYTTEKYVTLFPLSSSYIFLNFMSYYGSNTEEVDQS